jgi:TolB-like protein
MRDALIQAMRAGGSPTRWAIQLVASAVVLLGLVYFLSLELGLPSWVFQALAIVSGIQIGMLVFAMRAERSGQRLKRLSRRRIQAVGAAAVVIVGLFSAFLMSGRALGSGPAEAAVATNQSSVSPRILLVDFVNRTADPLLGFAATDAFRVDLAQAGLLSALRPDDVVESVTSNGATRNVDAILSFARTQGVLAVLMGEVTRVGQGFMLSARLVSPEDRVTLAAERVSAASSNDVISAIDSLSARMSAHALEVTAARR